MYDEKLDNEHNVLPLSGEHLDRQDAFDYAIDKEKSKIEKVKKCFRFIELGVLCFLLVVNIYFRYQNLINDHWSAEKNRLIFTSIVFSIPSFILCWSAIKLTRAIKSLARKKPNLCLIYWHIFNSLSVCASLSAITSTYV